MKKRRSYFVHTVSRCCNKRNPTTRQIIAIRKLNSYILAKKKVSSATEQQSIAASAHYHRHIFRKSAQKPKQRHYEVKKSKHHFRLDFRHSHPLRLIFRSFTSAFYLWCLRAYFLFVFIPKYGTLHKLSLSPKQRKRMRKMVKKGKRFSLLLFQYFTHIIFFSTSLSLSPCRCCCCCCLQQDQICHRLRFFASYTQFCECVFLFIILYSHAKCIKLLFSSDCFSQKIH